MKGLSKSRYTQFCQCPKAFWLKLFKPELEEIDDSLQSRFEQGTEVGDLAMGLLGDYVEVTTYKEDGSLDLKSMIEKTRQEIERGTENICEASFSFMYEGISNYCAVDILHREKDGWSTYEVKSSTFSTDKKDTADKLLVYTRDITYQKWVLRNCGIHITGTYLIRLNSNYIRKGKLELDRLFHIKDMKELVNEIYPEVEANIKRVAEVIKEDEPGKKIGVHCQNPYGCSFLDYCLGELPSPNVFDLYRMKFEKKCELFNRGKVSFSQLIDEPLSEMQLLQVESHLNNTCHIYAADIKEFLNKLRYPLYFLDFETMQPVIPPYDDCSPYQQLTFQYSLHWIDEEAGKLFHTEYLGNSVDDPRRELAEKLCKDIPADVCVTAYNKSFECGRIDEMAEIFPDLRDHLLAIRENIVDLIEPFRGKMVYLPAMNGSFSIKKVLPA